VFRVRTAVLTLAVCTSALAPAAPLAAADGQLDYTYLGGALAYGSPSELLLYRSLVAPDGQVVVAGFAYSSGSGYGLEWRAFSPTGGGVRCQYFPPGADFAVPSDAMFDHAGRLLVQTDVWQGNHLGQVVTRFLYPSCTLDPSFDGSGVLPIDFAAFQLSGGGLAEVAVGSPPEWRLLVGGTRDEAGIFLARFTDDGQYDPAFGGGDGWLYLPMDNNIYFTSRMRIDRQGRPVISGMRPSPAQTDWDLVVTRLTASGAFDTSFAGTGTATYVLDPAIPDSEVGRDLLIQPDGRIVVAGYLQHDESSVLTYRGFAVRLLPNGNLDPSFSGDGFAVLNGPADHFDLIFHGAVLQGDGKLVVAGEAHQPDALGNFVDSDTVVARLRPDGTLDSGFGAGGRTLVSFSPDPATDEEAFGVALSAGRPVVAVGIYPPSGGLRQGGIFRLTNSYVFADGFEDGSAGAWTAP
jgi:uncharacterized delta-60 repeat protein